MVNRFEAGDTATDFSFDTPWESSQRFFTLAGEQPVVLVFLRYYGCPVCQMEMAELKREINLFADKNATVVVCLQSAPATLAAATQKEDWPFTIVCDPDGNIFTQYGVAPRRDYKVPAPFWSGGGH